MAFFTEKTVTRATKAVLVVFGFFAVLLSRGFWLSTRSPGDIISALQPDIAHADYVQQPSPSSSCGCECGSCGGCAGCSGCSGCDGGGP